MIYTNLGQSEFQDKYFVAGAQLTPFRQLRQIELEIRSIQDTLKRTSISKRRLELSISKLNPAKAEDALDIEEFLWDLEHQNHLIFDATKRLENFEKMKSTLLENTPKEYWDIGYEEAELEHWTKFYSNQLALMQITGQPSLAVMQQILLMPESAQAAISLSAKSKILEISQIETKSISNS